MCPQNYKCTKLHQIGPADRKFICQISSNFKFCSALLNFSGFEYDSAE